MADEYLLAAFNTIMHLNLFGERSRTEYSEHCTMHMTAFGSAIHTIIIEVVIHTTEQRKCNVYYYPIPIPPHIRSLSLSLSL